MLTPYLPYPLTSGGQTRSYNLIKNLSKKHEITLFSLIKDDKEKKYIPELEKFCKKVAVFNRSKSPWTLRNILMTGFGTYPFLVIRNLAPKEKEAVRHELENDKYDLIHAETFYVMPHIPRVDIPTLLVDQTVEYLVYEHYVQEQVPFWLRPILWIDVLKIKYWETYYWKQAKKVIAMSYSDGKIMESLAPGLKVGVVPNGVDVEYFSEKKREETKVPKVLYLGNFSWLQNVEAAEALVAEVWPNIKKKIPNSKLWIVGKDMPERVKILRTSDIEVTEGIPDNRDAYTQASVLVTPIKGPGGTRLKILEAMASSLPVVTTSTGAEGLDLTDGKNALIRNDFDELAEAAVKVLKDPELAIKLGVEGKRFVEQRYTWQKNAELLSKIYEEVVYQK